MRPLPAAIARWVDDLAVFTREVGDLIGPWLPILERVRGAVSLPQAHAEGEPDGLSGLTRRGLYQRLLVTEWALLDEAPDEFVRRAGAGEHLFHQVARAETVGAGRVVALFDAGPWQLGAPRLAHLAWLLILARHARSRSVHFTWGVLQAPDAGLRDSTEAADIRALMAARTYETVDAGMVAAWADRLGPAARREERWLVTHARDEPTTSRLEALTLAIAESDDPLAPALVLDATSRINLKDRAVLPLPPRRTCGRLLRDPIRGQPQPGAGPRPAQASATIAQGAQVVFSATGPHLLARLDSGEIVALAIPADQQGPPRLAARFTPAAGASVVAAGWRKGKMHVLTSDDLALTVHSSHGSRWRHPRPLRPAPELTLPVTSPAVLDRLFIDRAGEKLWFCDQRWRLHAADLGGLVLKDVGDAVVAWTNLPARGQLAFVQRKPGGPVELRTISERGSDSVRLLDGGHRISQGHVVASSNGEDPAFVALGSGDGEWHLCSPSSPSSPSFLMTNVRLPADTPVYGAALIEGRRCLLVRSAARDGLDFIDGEVPIASLNFPDQVDHACIHPNGQWIAAQIAGGVCVVNRRGKEQMRWGGPWA